MKTKAISKFGIIFAVALTMVTTVVFTACNSEDDFGGDLDGNITGQYSLATRMMTQRMEGEFTELPLIQSGSTSTSTYDGLFDVSISWTSGHTTRDSDRPSIITASAIMRYENNRYTVTGASASWTGNSYITGSVKYDKKSNITKRDDYGNLYTIDTVLHETSKFEAHPHIEEINAN